ncbi:MAG TPA: peptide antibiotic transporter SbmA [Caulobacteraceae bacterium]|nr:peptide antibiotic transporter SbmA [Caulobacteraceae bacterium]
MFVSFFPRPRLFFPSAALWAALAVGLWYGWARALGARLGFAQHGPPVIGIAMFWTGPFLWFDLYYGLAVALFAGFWRLFAPHPWWRWSVLGSALILFVTYLQVEVSVGVNNWYGPFYDLIQAALGHTRHIAASEYYGLLLVFLWLALAAVFVGVLTYFFISHYIFRWRTAMNDHYVARWPQLRGIEGASQRIQEDTMRFSSTTESLGLSFISSLMTLIAFIPVLIGLSAHITQLPLLGDVPGALVWVAVVWSIFGTGLLALVGVRLPGIEFRNQRVEAAYRKELVYGEDDPDRARPPTLRELFSAVRKNYFSLYFNFVYFNVARILYLQTSVIVPFIALGPSIVAGAITLGVFTQITAAFGQVLSAFQYLVSSWTTIVELQSIYRRLRAFEAQIRHQKLSGIEYSPDPADGAMLEPAHGAGALPGMARR